jgi:hypothetical protein
MVQNVMKCFHDCGGELYGSVKEYYSTISVIQICASLTRPVIWHQVPDGSTTLCRFLRAAEADLCSVEPDILICLFFNIN